MSKPFQFTRLENGKKERTTNLLELLRIDRPEQARWLCVGAHDDDIAGGEGMWVAAARQAGIQVDVLIATDGRMGYCSAEQRHSIVQIRKQETFASFELLGVGREHVHYIDYPDDDLFVHQGRRLARPGEQDIAGFVGLQNAFTWYLRRLRPTHLFFPTPTDLHPDHRIVHQEMMISVYHAQGIIWPELGEPLEKLPTIYESATYSHFRQPPNLELRAADEVLELKLKALGVFRSQAQIELFLNHVRAGGPYEYLCEFAYPFYSPNHYKVLFA
ncbi:MAG TPA: PIG-L family deacetylase [Phycisphaerae bacterium]|nr:PIG-L family deacetylase [Phycisphaerae bacterium]